MEKRLVSGELYRHYKGGLYRIVDECINAEKDEHTVIYENESGERFTRGIWDFFSQVNIWGNEYSTVRFVWVENGKNDTVSIDGEKSVVERARTNMWGDLATGPRPEKTILRDVVKDENKADLKYSDLSFPDEKTVDQINQMLSDIREDLETSKPNKDGFSFFSDVVGVTREDLHKINQEFEAVSEPRFMTTAEQEFFKRLEKDKTDFKNYVSKEVIEARLLAEEDIDGFETSVTPLGHEELEKFIIAPKKEGGRVKRQFGIPGEDYLVLGEGFAKIVSKEK